MDAIQRFKGAGGSNLKASIFLGAFALLLGFTGGASRYDAFQIVPLRTLSGLMLLPAIYFLSIDKLRMHRVLLILMGGIFLLTVVQIIPLPPSIWHELPQRQSLIRLDEALGLGDVWRPLTLTPMRTWNSIGALVVPLAGLLLAVSLTASSRLLLQIIAGLGGLSAILGLMQVVGGSFSPFYFYEVTNRGGVVGIFANENHAGIFAACSMLVVAQLWIGSRNSEGGKWSRLVYPSAFFLIFLAALVGGSRAGFAAALGAVLVSFGVLILSPKVGGRHSGAHPISRWMDRHPHATSVLPFFVLFAIAMLFVLLGRSSAFADLVARDSFDDLRWSIWSVLADMVGSFWLVGSGFGSFEQVYKAYEPADLLMPRYVNQAHNDWVQILIEGGVVAAGIIVFLVLWLVSVIGKLASTERGRSTALFWTGIVALIGGASLIDYPLRTPLFQVVGVWFLLALSQDYRDPKTT